MAAPAQHLPGTASDLCKASSSNPAYSFHELLQHFASDECSQKDALFPEYFQKQVLFFQKQKGYKYKLRKVDYCLESTFQYSLWLFSSSSGVHIQSKIVVIWLSPVQLMRPANS